MAFRDGDGFGNGCDGLGDQPALTPEPVSRPDWLKEEARQRRELAEKGAGVFFLGDSLTSFWPVQGLGSWELDIKPFEPFNAGIAGDRVENAHFRFRRTQFGPRIPAVFVVWCGTNNLAKHPPDDPERVANGVVALAMEIQKNSPDSRVLVISIIPSGFAAKTALRWRIATANKVLKERTRDTGIAFLDIHDLFLDPEGQWRPGLTIDGTHLTGRGYETVTKPLKDLLLQWLPDAIGK